MPKKKSEPTLAEELESLAEQVNRVLGVNGKVTTGRDPKLKIERIPSGILAFDYITGGGLPRKLNLELYGQESSGKTTLALNIVAAVQKRTLFDVKGRKRKGVGAWVVGEEFDDAWAERQGVDLNRLIKIEALTGDLMLETAVTYLESGLIDVMVIDSIQALGTQRELDAGVDSESYAGAGAPQMWGRFYRATRSLFNGGKSKAAIVTISQAREAIGSFSPAGKPEPIPTQIRVLKHWKSISIYCKRGEPTFKDPKSEKKRIISREFKLHCKKNKTAVPEKVGSFVYNFTKDSFGIDRADEAYRLGRVYGLIEQRGARVEGYGIQVKGTKDEPGAQQYIEKLRRRPVVMTELYTDIRSAILADS